MPIANAAQAQAQMYELIKAKFTLLYVRTVEERRVQAAAEGIGSTLGLPIYLWSISGGMYKVPREDEEPEVFDCDDPIKALDFIRSAKGRGIFVLRDFDPYIEPQPQNAMVIRSLRELADELAGLKQDVAKFAIIVAPRLVLPDSLRASTVVIDWPLPDRTELIDTLTAVVDNTERKKPELLSELVKDKAKRVELYSNVATSAQGLTLIEAQNAFALSMIKHRTIKAGEIADYKEQAVTKSGLLEWRKPKGGFARVAGLLDLRKWLIERKRGFSEAARAYGLDMPKGVLLTGVPGCGKSAMADALAFEWEIPLLSWDVGKTFGKYQGQSEEQIRTVIATAEAVAPCILRVDEAEKGFSGAGGSGEADGGSSGRMFATFLTWMQEKTAPVFVYATCNDADKIPAEFLRMGRFDQVFFVDLPNEEERRGIWEVHLGLRKRDPSKFDLDALVNASLDMSGAEIEGTLVNAMYSAFSAEEEVSSQHLLTACKATVPLNKTAPAGIEKVRTWANGRARKASAPISKKSEGRFANLEL